MSQSEALAFARTIATAEAGEETFLFPSGTAALFTALCGASRGRKKILVARNVYPPIYFLMHALRASFGIDMATFDPQDAAALSALLDDQCGAVLVETFGSWTYELSDIEGIADACHAHGALLIVDNTSATPLGCRPIPLGADLVVHSLTKYIGGHAELVGGAVVASARHADHCREYFYAMGFTNSEFPREVATAFLRSWETLPLRLASAQANTRTVLDALAGLPAISRINHASTVPANRMLPAFRELGGLPSLIGLHFRLSRELLNARLATCPAIHSGFGWGGAHSKLLPLPEQYLEPRRDLPDSAIARLYVGAQLDDGSIDALRALFAE